MNKLDRIKTKSQKGIPQLEGLYKRVVLQRSQNDKRQLPKDPLVVGKGSHVGVKEHLLTLSRIDSHEGLARVA